MGFGIVEMLIILLVIVLIFGAKKLPELGKGLGQGIKEFKSANKDPQDVKVTTVHPVAPRTDRDV